MSRIHEVISRYNACRAVARDGVEIIAVGDPVGEELNAAVRDTLRSIDDVSSDVRHDLIRAANVLRWRRMTQPQPNRYMVGVEEAAETVRREAKRLKGFVSNQRHVDDILAATEAVLVSDSPVGVELLRCIEEVGAKNCVVIAMNSAARAGLQVWLTQYDVKVALHSEYDRDAGQVEQSYVVGAPLFFSASLVTAPATEAITFLMPAWFANRTLPKSVFAEHGEGGLEVRARIHLVGTSEQPKASGELPPAADTFFPQPVWGFRKSGDREPQSDETEAWKLLLCGGLGLWLDDGERIRSINPSQPEGDRISYEAVARVQPGTYLVLREGEPERGAMYEAAIAAVGPRGPAITSTQSAWKSALADRLDRTGLSGVVNALTNKGVRSASRVTAWVEPTLICPKREENLAVLLDWLGIAREPTYTNALTLRRSLYRAIADLRMELEAAVAQADMTILERDGFMRLDLKRDGFRSMIVARVLARAPFTEIVNRNQTRIPFKDKDAQWLE